MNRQLGGDVVVVVVLGICHVERKGEFEIGTPILAIARHGLAFVISRDLKHHIDLTLISGISTNI